LVAAQAEIAAEAVENLQQEGIEADYRLLTGRPFLEIIHEAYSFKADLVIKDALGEGPKRGGLFGSTALHLLRKAPCPVWMVKRGEPRRYRRIVAAIDPDPSDTVAAEVAVDVLRLASTVAAAEDSTLEVVHAWWVPSELLLRSPRLRLPLDEVKTLARSIRREAKHRMSETLEKAQLGEAQREKDQVVVTLRKGRPFEVIAARAKEADLVVMATVSRTGIPGLVVGNTAESVFQRLDTSLLAIKPQGFESPIRPHEGLA